MARPTTVTVAGRRRAATRAAAVRTQKTATSLRDPVRTATGSASVAMAVPSVL
ncbi:hypothetical protein GCM10010191_83450 [Actinomadura vinacea]|uniref:Uncharacterized protein n=1 Tax=Actinomadura vinacea TaxID=115336 RepID=A0ABN3KBY9_9ACTN